MSQAKNAHDIKNHIKRVLTNHPTNRETVVAVVVVHVAITTVEVQVATVDNIACVERTTPIVAVTTNIVNAATIAVTSSRELNKPYLKNDA